METKNQNESPNKTKRFTKQRQAILDALKDTTSHPDANWVYQQVIQELPKVSLGTVYRNLNLLTEERIIKELNYQPNVTRYEPSFEPHHHIICTVCNKIEDIKPEKNCEVSSKYLDILENNLNYSNIDCEILFKGICSDCQHGHNRN